MNQTAQPPRQARDTEALAFLSEKIARQEALVSVVGLGYVGLPLAMQCTSAGFRVVGIDIDEDRVGEINRGISSIRDVSSETLRGFVQAKTFSSTTEYRIVREADVVIICVPTPLRKTKDPDISYILAAIREITPVLRSGHLVILESTTYPGTTEEVILPALEQSGLAVGQDFFLAFSPERIDPGNEIHKLVDIPKVVGGVTPACTRVAGQFYSKIGASVVEASSSKTAEMVKLLENTFRNVNIALVNEIALICHRLQVDVWEVIDAAATKPFGYMPFYPGPGLGGHCIPIDPQYLSWKLKHLNYHARFIELATDINSNMPRYVVQRVTDLLNDEQKSISGSHLLLLGAAYKPEVSDTRESPIRDIGRLLLERGADVQYHDPYVPSLELEGTTLDSQELTPRVLRSMDCVIVITDHSVIDYQMIVDHAKRVLDTRNATKHVQDREQKVVRL